MTIKIRFGNFGCTTTVRFCRWPQDHVLLWVYQSPTWKILVTGQRPTC